MTRLQHKALIRTSRQQKVRTKKSLYHTPPQLTSAANTSIEESIANAGNPDNDNNTNNAGNPDYDSNTDNPSQLHPVQQCRRGLPECLQKELASDIEDHGGLRVFVLKDVVNAKPATYGKIKSARRRQVQNCVNEWKLLPDSEYYLKLNYFGVPASSLLSSFYTSKQTIVPSLAPRINLSSFSAPQSEAIVPPQLLEPSSPPRTPISSKFRTSSPFATPQLLEPSSPTRTPISSRFRTSSPFTTPPTQTLSARYNKKMNSSALVVRNVPGTNDEAEGEFMRQNCACLIKVLAS